MKIIAALLLPAWLARAQAENPACTWLQNDPGDQVGATRTQNAAKALQGSGLARSGETRGPDRRGLFSVVSRAST